jgi:5-bromo-4-chloroindolyl phosphate hydrolysis protein
MKILLLLTLLFSESRCADTTTVYICDSHNAKKYYLRANCRGLSDCSHRVVKIKLDDAKKSGKTLCGWEK